MSIKISGNIYGVMYTKTLGVGTRAFGTHSIQLSEVPVFACHWTPAFPSFSVSQPWGCHTP